MKRGLIDFLTGSFIFINIKKLTGGLKMRKLILAMVLLVLAAGIANAAVSTKMSVQGRLTNSTSGALIDSGDLKIVVTNSTGEVYNQTHSGAISNGLFYEMIGITASLDLNYNQDYNISVYVGSSSTPVGGPYAFRGGQGQVSTEDVADVYLLNSGDTAEGDYTFSSGTLTAENITISNRASCGNLYTDSNGDVLCGDDNTTVVAGLGLTGGGTSTSVTVNVGAGTGIIVNADDIAINTSAVPRKAIAETITATWTFPSVIITDNLFLQGNFTTYNVHNISVNGSMTPYFNDMFFLGSPSLAWTAGYFSDNVTINGYAALTQETSFAGNISGLYNDLQIASGAVISSKIADGNVTAAKLDTDSVTAVKIATDAVDSDEIAANAVTNSEMADNAIGNDEMADDAIGNAEMADNAVRVAEIADGNVTTAKLDVDAVTSVKLADNAVNSSKIADGNVTTAKIDIGAIIAAKLADGNVTTAKLDVDAVTNAKLADNAVESANIADRNVTAAKIDSNIALWTNSSGDALFTTGNVGITSLASNMTMAASTLQIGNVSDGFLDYTQIDVNKTDTTGPPSIDCDESYEAGRMLYDNTTFRLFICGGDKWYQTILTTIP